VCLPVLVLSCMKVAAMRTADTRPRISVHCTYDQENRKSGQVITKTYRAIIVFTIIIATSVCSKGTVILRFD
jgi:hypothetical protein